MMQSPFKDLFVIELATVLAGPSVGMFFAELGARVIKIENLKSGGDVTRSWKLPEETGEVSAYFSSINYGKEYLDLNLKEEGDRKVLNDMLASADILLTNFKSGSAEKLNLSKSTLLKEFPNLIIGQVSGFKSNPSRTAYDVVVQAETGFMHMNGTPEASPIKMPVALMDVLAAHQLKEGLLVALLNRGKTGKGCFVETNLEQTGIASLVNQASNYLMTGQIAQPIGSKHPNIAPYGDTFFCADEKQIVLAIGSDVQYFELLNALNVEDSSKLYNLNSNQERLKQRDFLIALLTPYFGNFKRDEILKKLIDKQIPAGAVRAMNEVFENPAALEMILEENINNEETKRVSSIAFNIEDH